MDTEKKAEALQNLLTNYGTEFRAYLVLGVCLPFMVAWTAVFLRGGSLGSAATFLSFITVLVILVVSYGTYEYSHNYYLKEVARLLIAKAAGKKVILVRKNYLTPIEQVELKPHWHGRLIWEVREHSPSTPIGVPIGISLKLTPLQAFSVQQILNNEV